MVELIKEKPQKVLLTGEGLNPSPKQVPASDKLFDLWLLGVGNKFKEKPNGEVFQIMAITKTDVLAASEKDSWAFEHNTKVILV